MSMDDPIAFYLTWPTYGTWLPGDHRGWVEHRRGWQLPDPIAWLEARSLMKENACRLSPVDRQIVEAQVAETCVSRGWILFAANCRSNHIHVVIGACETSPKKIRNDIKAWSTRRLRAADPNRDKWWAERGSERHIYTEESLETVVAYVTEAQDRKHLDRGSS